MPCTYIMSGTNKVISDADIFVSGKYSVYSCVWYRLCMFMSDTDKALFGTDIFMSLTV